MSKSPKKGTSKGKSEQRKISGERHGMENLRGNTFRDKPERINKKGRPPKLIHHIVEELKGKGYEPVTETQIVDAYQALLQLPKAEIKALQDDENKPYFLRLVAKWMDSPRGMEMLDRIMDRSFGKVIMRQSIDANIKTEQPLFPDFVTTKQDSAEQNDSSSSSAFVNIQVHARDRLRHFPEKS